MLLIFGTKAYVTVMGVVTFVCQYCGNPGSQRVEKWATKFTLFFIPTFTVSTKYVVQCAVCGTQSRLEKVDAERLTAGVPGGQRKAGSFGSSGAVPGPEDHRPAG